MKKKPKYTFTYAWVTDPEKLVSAEEVKKAFSNAVLKIKNA